MNVKEINSAIMFGNLSNDELSLVIDAVKFARAQLTQKTKRSVSLGSKVKFTSGRTGQVVIGTVEKVAIKYITVREVNPSRLTSGVWRVPANMLELVA